MLHINDLHFRIEGKPIFEGATASIPQGHRVGIVGRNGAGKTTLFRLITGELSPDEGQVSWPRLARLGYVAQEAPGTDETLLEWVLAADTERSRLLAEAETASEPGRIAEIQLRLVDIAAHSAPARAAQILAGLGFDAAAQHRRCREFSGGWRMRVALAAVLFLMPELLLLDEPTNYLDLEGTIWLESYLKSYPHTVLIISHDRDLLNTVVTSILHLERGRLAFYTGGYDDFEESRRARQRLETRLQKKQDEERRRIEAFIARFKAKATKAAQARSRAKALERMKPIAAQIDERVAPFHLAAPERALASPIVTMERVSVGYGEGAPVLSGLDLRIDHDDRIALLGQNGNGKSTFAKLIAGRLEARGGQIRLAPKLRVGYFAQHQLEELDPAATPLRIMTGLMPEASESQRRARLGTYGFGIDTADTAVASLSGGEKARLMLMVVTFERPHLLILDEPTNHLDIDSREALIHALAEFDGAVILITHDRHLLETSADRLWVVAGGSVRAFDGDIDGYRAMLLEERSGRGQRDGEARERASAAAASRADQRRIAAQRRSELAPLKAAVDRAERTLERLASDIGKVDGELADPGLYARDAARAQKLSMMRGQLAKQLAEAEETWLAASEALQTAQQYAERS